MPLAHPETSGTGAEKRGAVSGCLIRAAKHILMKGRLFSKFLCRTQVILARKKYRFLHPEFVKVRTEQVDSVTALLCDFM